MPGIEPCSSGLPTVLLLLWLKELNLNNQERDELTVRSYMASQGHITRCLYSCQRVCGPVSLTSGSVLLTCVPFFLLLVLSPSLPADLVSLAKSHAPL